MEFLLNNRTTVAHLCNLNIMNVVSSAILDRDMVSVLLVMTIIYNIVPET